MRKYRKSYKRTDLIERAHIAEERVKSLRFNITASEMRVLALLEKLSFEFIFQEAFFDEWYFIIADFYLPGIKLIIEVDGDSHLGKSQKMKEAKRKRWLAKKGIKVLRIKNKATINMKPNHLHERILRCISKNNNKKD